MYWSRIEVEGAHEAPWQPPMAADLPRAVDAAILHEPAPVLFAEEALGATRSLRDWLAGLGSRAAGLFTRTLEPAARALREFDHAPDLAEEIGTPRWWRGVALVGALLGASALAWPGLKPIPLPPSTRLDAAALDEFRAGSARRMGPTLLVRRIAFVPEPLRLSLTAIFGADDSLTALLARIGMSAADAARAAAMVAGATGNAALPAGTPLAITLGPRGADGTRPLAAMRLRARFDLDLALDREGDNLVVTRQALAVDDTPVRITGLAGTSLYRSARAAGAPVAAVEQYLRALDDHGALDDVQPGDRFDLVLSWRHANGGGGEPGDLLYAGLGSGDAPRTRLLRWGPQGTFADALHFGEAQTVVSGGGGIAAGMPVAGHLTSGFGMRFHPILGYSRLHAGVDLGAPWGSPVIATGAGQVVWAGPHGGHGNYVRIDHGGGLASGYAHLSRFAVSFGMRVSAGQVIGYVGSTGLSTGPHLHYEVFRNGRPVDPLGGAMGSGPTITTTVSASPAEIAAFRAKLATMLALRPGAVPATTGLR